MSTAHIVILVVVVGLGTIFGQILERSGGAESLAHHLVKNSEQTVVSGW